MPDHHTSLMHDSVYKRKVSVNKQRPSSEIYITVYCCGRPPDYGTLIPCSKNSQSETMRWAVARLRQSPASSREKRQTRAHRPLLHSVLRSRRMMVRGATRISRDHAGNDISSNAVYVCPWPTLHLLPKGRDCCSGDPQQRTGGGARHDSSTTNNLCPAQQAQQSLQE